MATIRVKTDYPTIQAAVDAAAPGDEIIVEDGIYNEQVLVSQNYIKIIGGNNTILDGKMQLGTGFILNNTSNVEIISFIIKSYRGDGVDILGHGNSNCISKTHFFDINYYGIMVDAATANNRIINCNIEGAYYGIYDLGSDLDMKDCITSYCYRGFFSDTDSINASIEHCNFNYDNIGILVDGASTRIYKCIIYGSRTSGIQASASCSIDNNVIRNCGEGIHLTSVNSIIEGNQVFSNTTNGIYVDINGNNSIIYNMVNNNKNVGIFIVSEFNVITGNNVNRNGKYDIARVMVNNRIQNNYCNKSIPPWLCDQCTSEEILQEKVQQEVLQEEVQQEEVKQEEVQQEEVQQDEVQQEEVLQEEVQQEDVLQKERVLQDDKVQEDDKVLQEDKVQQEEVLHYEESCYADIKVPDDYPTIQAAVDAALPGNIILVKSGVYHEQIIIKKDFITILGGRGTVLDGKMKLNVGYTIRDAIGIEIKAFLIKNYRSVGIEILGSSKGNVIKNVRILNNNYYGIGIDISVENNRITECTIEGNYVGILDFGRGLRIDHSKISYNGIRGVLSVGDNVSIFHSVVEENLFDTGIECMGNGNHIVGCKVLRNGTNGIMVHNNSTVEDNEVYENANHGIWLRETGSIAKNNRVWSNIYYGMLSNKNNSIIGNTATANGLYGIAFNQENNVDGNTAYENKLYDLVRLSPNNIIGDNSCGKCLPPWICSEHKVEKELLENSEDEDIMATIHVPTDYSTIQAAVDAAYSGDIILVDRGVYHEQVTIKKDFIKIIGKNKTILDGEMKLDSGFVLSDANGVEIRSFIIENYKNIGISILSGNGNIVSRTRIIDNVCNISVEAAASNCVVADSIIMGGGDANYNSSKNLRIERCQIKYNAGTGIYCNNCNCHVDQSNISQNLGNGINYTGSDHFAYFIDNQLYENRYTALIAYGNCLIKGNDISHNYYSGIGFMANHCVIEDNLICSNEQGGITVGAGAYVIKNVICDNARDGISLTENNLVEDNTIQRNQDFDIIRIRANNVIRKNSCSQSMPPWICDRGCPITEMGKRSEAFGEEETL